MLIDEEFERGEMELEQLAAIDAISQAMQRQQHMIEDHFHERRSLVSVEHQQRAEIGDDEEIQRQTITAAIPAEREAAEARAAERVQRASRSVGAGLDEQRDTNSAGSASFAASSQARPVVTNSAVADDSDELDDVTVLRQLFVRESMMRRESDRRAAIQQETNAAFVELARQLTASSAREATTPRQQQRSATPTPRGGADQRRSSTPGAAAASRTPRGDGSRMLFHDDEADDDADEDKILLRNMFIVQNVEKQETERRGGIRLQQQDEFVDITTESRRDAHRALLQQLQRRDVAPADAKHDDSAAAPSPLSRQRGHRGSRVKIAPLPNDSNNTMTVSGSSHLNDEDQQQEQQQQPIDAMPDDQRSSTGNLLRRRGMSRSGRSKPGQLDDNGSPVLFVDHGEGIGDLAAGGINDNDDDGEDSLAVTVNSLNGSIAAMGTINSRRNFSRAGRSKPGKLTDSGSPVIVVERNESDDELTRTRNRMHDDDTAATATSTAAADGGENHLQARSGLQRRYSNAGKNRPARLQYGSMEHVRVDAGDALQDDAVGVAIAADDGDNDRDVDAQESIPFSDGSIGDLVANDAPSPRSNAPEPLLTTSQSSFLQQQQSSTAAAAQNDNEALAASPSTAPVAIDAPLAQSPSASITAAPAEISAPQHIHPTPVRPHQQEQQQEQQQQQDDASPGAQSNGSSSDDSVARGILSQVASPPSVSELRRRELDRVEEAAERTLTDLFAATQKQIQRLESDLQVARTRDRLRRMDDDERREYELREAHKLQRSEVEQLEKRGRSAVLATESSEWFVFEKPRREQQQFFELQQGERLKAIVQVEDRQRGFLWKEHRRELEAIAEREEHMLLAEVLERERMARAAGESVELTVRVLGREQQQQTLSTGGAAPAAAASSASTAAPDNKTLLLPPANKIVDFQQLRPPFNSSNNFAKAADSILLARKVQRLTSRLAWENRILLVAPTAVLLCGEDSTVRRAIFIADLVACHITKHPLEGFALGFTVRDSFDCVVRAAPLPRNASKLEMQEAVTMPLTDVAALLAQLNPAMRVTAGMVGAAAASKKTLKEVASAGRKLPKDSGFVAPSKEVKTAVSKSSSSAPAALSSASFSPSASAACFSMLTSPQQHQHQQNQRNRSSNKKPFVKDLPPDQKERVSQRVKTFYEKHHPEGLTDFDKNIQVVLTTYEMTEDDVMQRMCGKYKVDVQQERREAMSADLLPPDAGDFVANDANFLLATDNNDDTPATPLARSQPHQLEKSSDIPDFKKPHNSIAPQYLQNHHKQQVLLARQVMRLTSKLKWEPRVAVITNTHFDLVAGEDFTVRRSIPVADIEQLIVTSHWQGSAVAIIVRNSFDCVLRSHEATPKEHPVRHIAALLVELNPSISLRVVTSRSGAKMKEVVSEGRQLAKPEGTTAAAAATASSLSSPTSPVRVAGSPATPTAAAPFYNNPNYVKNLPASEKERISRRVKTFYENHHPAGLKEFDKNMTIALSSFAMTEEAMMKTMCSKYKVDEQVEEREAREANLLPPEVDAEYLERMTLYYRRHNPSKVDSVRSLLAKHRGKEKELMQEIVQRYGVPEDEENSNTVVDKEQIAFEWRRLVLEDTELSERIDVATEAADSFRDAAPSVLETCEMFHRDVIEQDWCKVVDSLPIPMPMQKPQQQQAQQQEEHQEEQLSSTSLSSSRQLSALTAVAIMELEDTESFDRELIAVEAFERIFEVHSVALQSLHYDERVDLEFDTAFFELQPLELQCFEMAELLHRDSLQQRALSSIATAEALFIKALELEVRQEIVQQAVFESPLRRAQEFFSSVAVEQQQPEQQKSAPVVAVAVAPTHSATATTTTTRAPAFRPPAATATASSANKQAAPTPIPTTATTSVVVNNNNNNDDLSSSNSALGRLQRAEQSTRDEIHSDWLSDACLMAREFMTEQLFGSTGRNPWRANIVAAEAAGVKRLECVAVLLSLIVPMKEVNRLIHRLMARSREALAVQQQQQFKQKVQQQQHTIEASSSSILSVTSSASKALHQYSSAFAHYWTTVAAAGEQQQEHSPSSSSPLKNRFITVELDEALFQLQELRDRVLLLKSDVLDHVL